MYIRQAKKLIEEGRLKRAAIKGNRLVLTFNGGKTAEYPRRKWHSFLKMEVCYAMDAEDLRKFLNGE